MIKSIIKYVFTSLILVVIGVAIGQHPEVKAFYSNQSKSLSKLVKEVRLMERAKAIKKKASQSTNRFFSKKKTSKAKVFKPATPKSINQMHYAYGTDSFDPSNNARCLLRGYNVFKKNGKKTLRLNAFCQGNIKLQKKIRKRLIARIGEGR